MEESPEGVKLESGLVKAALRVFVQGLGRFRV